MNTTTSSKVSILIMSITFFMLSFAVNANSNIEEWYGNQNFSFSDYQNELIISINKNPWEAFTLKISSFELMNNPVVNLQIKADQNLVLRIDISDGIFVSSATEIIEKSLAASVLFTDLKFDFTDVLSDIDLSENTYLIFYVNPGKKFTGQISIQDVEFLNETNTKNEVKKSEEENSLIIYPSPATDFAFIEIPNEEFLFLKVVDLTGKEILSFDTNGISGFEFRLDVNNLEKGCYIVKLIGSNKTWSGKLVVQ